MKKILMIIYVVVCVSIFGESVVIAVNSAPPYRIIDGSNLSGIYIDLIKEVAKINKIDIKFKEMPFRRALEMMKNGEVDIMLGPNITEERKEYMYFIEKYPLPKENKAFYYYYEKNNIEKYEDLYGKRVDVLRGAVYFKKFDEDKHIIKNEVNEYIQAMLKVKSGRSDIVIMPEMQGDYLIKESKIDLKKSIFKAEGNSSYIAVSKKSKNFKEIVNKLESGMKEITDKKNYEVILVKYGKIDVKSK